MMPPVNLFQANLDLVFFVYGLAFFALGLIITFRINRHSHFELMRLLWWLAGFGFVHGGLEWIDLWRIVHGNSPVLALIRPGMLVLSFLFLFEFGRRLIRAAGVETPMTRAILLYLFLMIGLLGATIFPERSALELEIAVRYLLGFPGATLSALGLILYHRHKMEPIIDGNEEYPGYLKSACEVAAAGFLAYGLLAGLIVPRAAGFPAHWLNHETFLAATGIPVQLARAGCAVIITIAMGFLLRVFHAEIVSRLRRDQRTMEIHAEQLWRQVVDRTASMERSEARLQLILDTSAAGIYGTDIDGRITFVNPVACEMLGYPAGQLIGRHEHETLHHSHPNGTPYPPGTCPILKSLTGGAIVQNDREIFWCADGRPLFILYACQPMRSDGQIIGSVVSFLDISAQVEAEQTLEEILAEAQRLARVKSQFLATMSHEIRTPMNTIIGFAEVVLQDPALAPQATGQVRKILESTRALMGILNNIMDLSRLESGQCALEITCFNLPDLLTDAIQTIRHRADKKHLTIHLEYDKALPVWVMGDASRLRQVILNLLGNAIKFTERGGVTLLARPEETTPDLFHFTVSDTGIGMTPEQLSQVFDLFTQGDQTASRRFGGTGIGATLSKRIVEWMGGRIWVDSQMGAGTLFHFTVRLPRSQPAERDAHETREPLPLANQAVSEILETFDAEAIRRLLTELLAALNELNPDAAEPILAGLVGHMAKSHLVPLQNCLEAFDFARARQQAIALADHFHLNLE
ncbi:MAG: ATP-binding protein [Pseudomonadota bacterium]